MLLIRLLFSYFEQNAQITSIEQLKSQDVLNKGISLDTGLSQQTKDQSLIYYETVKHICNCRLSHMKHNRHIPSIM